MKTAKTKPSGKVKAKGSNKAGTAGSEPAAAAADRAAAEAERKRLQAELEVAAASLKAQQAAARQLEEQLAALRLRQAEAEATSADVLRAQQREKDQLEEAARQLERQLEGARQDAAQLQRSLQAALDDAAAAASAEEEDEQPSSEMQRMLSHNRRQEERIAAQQGELDTLRLRLQHTEQALAAERLQVAALQTRAQSRSELRFVRGSPWLVHVARERLTGAAPVSAHCGGGALAAVGRRHLVLECPAGTASGAAGPEQQQQQQPRSLHILDLGTHAWSKACSTGSSADGGTCASQPAPAPGVTGRAVCSVGSKLLGFGGMCKGQLLASPTQFLVPDLQQWLPAPPSADPAAPRPPPRQNAALAYCPRANAAFLFGGQAEDGSCLADLWAFDMATLVWTRLDTAATSRPVACDRARTPCISELPQPCSGAGLAVSEDGARLWLMGGRLDSGRCTSTLHWFDLTMHYWAAVDIQESCPVEPRTQHVMACVGRRLIIAGGINHTASGQVVQLTSTVVFDMADSSFEPLDTTAFEPTSSAAGPQAVLAVAAAKSTDYDRRSTSSGSGNSGKLSRQQIAAAAGAGLGSSTAVFVGSKLLMLKRMPGNGLLAELWTVDLQLPEAIEQQRQAKHSLTTVVTQLTIRHEAATATSIRLSWRAPTVKSDRVLSYKLMVTNMLDGRAREAYEGPETAVEVTGLAALSQYVFCVKCLFDDASFLWSEPLLATTLKAAPRPAK